MEASRYRSSSQFFTMTLVVMIPLLAIFWNCSTVSGACCTGKSLALCKPDGRLATAHTRLCGDCSIGTPNCGYGKCNFFGCACKGGCRKGGCDGNGCGGRGKRDLFSTDDSSEENVNQVEEIMSQFDRNSDRKLDEEETRVFWQNSTMKNNGLPSKFRQEFKKLDKNQDGFLTAAEIDSDN